MTLTTKRRLITGSLLGVVVFTGAVAGWVGGEVMAGFWLGWCSALLAAIGSHIRAEMLLQEQYTDANKLIANMKAQLNN